MKWLLAILVLLVGCNGLTVDREALRAEVRMEVKAAVASPEFRKEVASVVGEQTVSGGVNVGSVAIEGGALLAIAVVAITFIGVFGYLYMRFRARGKVVGALLDQTVNRGHFEPTPSLRNLGKIAQKELCKAKRARKERNGKELKQEKS